MSKTKDFYDDLIEMVNYLLEAYFKDSGITFEQSTVHKNNVDCNVLIFREEGKFASPSIYIDNYLSMDKSPEEIVHFIINDVYEAFEIAPDISDEIFSSEYIKNNLYATVVNFEKNEDYLKSVPYEKFCDLAIVPRVRIDDCASYVFTHALENQSKLTSEEVIEIAKRNTFSNDNFRLTTMKEVMAELTGVEVAPDIENMVDNSMSIISTKNKTHGAIAMLDKKFMASVSEKFGSDLYILPSSIHEVIVIPKTPTIYPQDLEDMVRDVNSNESVLSPQDFLSNHVYEFRAKDKKVVMVLTNREKLLSNHEKTMAYEKPRRR